MPLANGQSVRRITYTQQAKASAFLRENDPDKYQHKSLGEAARLLSRDLGFYVPHQRVEDIFTGAGLEFIPAQQRRRSATAVELDRLRAQMAALETRIDVLEGKNKVPHYAG